MVAPWLRNLCGVSIIIGVYELALIAEASRDETLNASSVRRLSAATAADGDTDRLIRELMKQNALLKDLLAGGRGGPRAASSRGGPAEEPGGAPRSAAARSTAVQSAEASGLLEGRDGRAAARRQRRLAGGGGGGGGRALEVREDDVDATEDVDATDTAEHVDAMDDDTRDSGHRARAGGAEDDLRDSAHHAQICEVPGDATETATIISGLHTCVEKLEDMKKQVEAMSTSSTTDNEQYVAHLDEMVQLLNQISQRKPFLDAFETDQKNVFEDLGGRLKQVMEDIPKIGGGI